MKQDAIYTIMTMTRLEVSDMGWPVFGSTRVVGYYREKEHALECVKYNCGDIWETCYNYAVVEKVEEGLYGITHEREFFKYNRETGEYDPYPEPDFMGHFVGLTMS